MLGIKNVGVLIVLFSVLMLLVSVETVLAANGTGVMVNNQVIAESGTPAYHDNIRMMPAKELVDAIGGTFSYDVKALTGVIKSGGNEMVLRLDNSTVMFNGKYLKAPAPMKIIGCRLYVPAEFIARKLGAEVYNNSKNIMMIYVPVEGKLVYKVMPGDTLWLVSQFFGTTVYDIKKLNGIINDTIYVGQSLVIRNLPPYTTSFEAYTSKSATIFGGEGFDYPAVGYLQAWTTIGITGKNGIWYSVTTPKGSGYIHSSVIYIKQDIVDNSADSTYFQNIIPVDTSMDYTTSEDYTVQAGDTIWSIAQKKGVPEKEIASFNGISLDTVLYPGVILKIPVHNIPVKEKAGSQYGEILDWFNEAQYLFPIGRTGKFTDLQSGISFMAKRTIGASHADVETLTTGDTQKMKDIFGGSWTWNRRSFLLEIDARVYAVSVAGMPHAGLDSMPFLKNVSDRSDGWGYGPNYDSIKGNGMDGHFDVYFLNCLRHVDNRIDSTHQASVMISGGLR